MTRDSGTTDRLRRLIEHITSLTETHELRWEKQIGSAHRYARLDNNLLILGPATPISESDAPRYLFITPFDSPDCIEVNSNDDDLGSVVMNLVKAVEASVENAPAIDPFAINTEFINRLKL
jgi:hypothetical protein